MKKKLKKKKIVVIAIVFIILLILGFFYLLNYNNDTYKTNIITAIKKETTEFGKNHIIEYTIQIKDYEIESAVKQITFESEQEAELEYSRYEIINKYELREIGLELKKEILILTMPEKQLLLDVEYNNEKDITMTLENGEHKKIINQDELKQSLIDQGYEIK